MGWIAGLMLPGEAAFWALVGMAAILGGTMRAPLTGAVFAVELTGDLHLLSPVIAASAAAYAVTVLLMKRSILTEKIARRGQHITREYAIDPFDLIRVSEVMVREVDTLRADMTIAQAVEAVEDGRRRIYPVIDAAERPVGLMSRAEALRWSAETPEPGETLGERISDAGLATVRPDDVAARAVDLMLAHDMGRLPVTDGETGRLVGLVTRKHLLEVRRASRQSEDQRQAFFSPAAARAARAPASRAAAGLRSPPQE
jgi:CBS domain-containing protein